jgi:hypothetical protein
MPEFDVFTPIRRADQDGSAALDAGKPRSYPDFGGPAPGAPVSPYGDAPLGRDAHGGDGKTYANTGTYGGENGDASGKNGDSAGSSDSGESGGSGPGDVNGLPRRVRQASLAPQLRGSAAKAGTKTPPGVPPATAASLSDMRNTLSAMQRGWQQGRSQTQKDTED